MLGTTRRKIVAALVAVGAIAAIAVGTSLAGGGVGGQVVGGGASANAKPFAAPVGHGIDTVVVTQGPANSYAGSTPTPTVLPGMSVQITVPAGHTALLIARFSAESSCSGGDSGSTNWCVVTIRVDGNATQPATGADFAFDSTDNGNALSYGLESHAMERYIQVGAGTHTVHVLGSTTLNGAEQPTFWTGERELTVESSLTS
jgi:hypothetical protein